MSSTYSTPPQLHRVIPRLTDIAVDALLDLLLFRKRTSVPIYLDLKESVPWNPYGRLIFERLDNWWDRSLPADVRRRVVRLLARFMEGYPGEVGSLPTERRSLRIHNVQITSKRAAFEEGTAFSAADPRPLTRLLRIASFGPILVRLELRGCGLESQDLVYFARLKSLISLDLRGNAGIGDDGVSHLVRVLGAGVDVDATVNDDSDQESGDGREVDDEALDSVSSLVNLQHLNLSLTSVTERTLSVLVPKFPHLHSLDVSNTQVPFKAVGRFLAVENSRSSNLHDHERLFWHLLDPTVGLFESDTLDGATSPRPRTLPTPHQNTTKRALDDVSLVKQVSSSFHPVISLASPSSTGGVATLLKSVAWPRTTDDIAHDSRARQDFAYGGSNVVLTQEEAKWVDGNVLRRFVLARDEDTDWKTTGAPIRASWVEGPRRMARPSMAGRKGLKDEKEEFPPVDSVSHAELRVWNGDRAFAPGTKFGRNGVWRLVKIAAQPALLTMKPDTGIDKHVRNSLTALAAPALAVAKAAEHPSPTPSTRVVSVAERGLDRVARVATVRGGVKTGVGASLVFERMDMNVQSSVQVEIPSMKFGRYLEQEEVPEWASRYVNYKKLKRLIKKIAVDLSATHRSPFFYRNGRQPISDLSNSSLHLPPAALEAPATAASSADTSSSSVEAAPYESGAEYSSLAPAGLRSDYERTGEDPSASPRRRPIAVKIASVTSFIGNRNIRNPVALADVIPTLLTSEREFFDYLDKQLEKVNGFFVQQTAIAESRLSAILEQLVVLKELQANPQLLAEDDLLPLIGIEVEETASAIKALSEVPHKLFHGTLLDRTHKSPMHSSMPNLDLERGLPRWRTSGKKRLHPPGSPAPLVRSDSSDEDEKGDNDNHSDGRLPSAATMHMAPVRPASSPRPATAQLSKRKGVSIRKNGVALDDNDDIAKQKDEILKNLGLDNAVTKQGLESAKSKLKKAVLEFYRFLILLRNFQTLNAQAFGKIMKKYEKLTGWGALSMYMDKVNKTEFAQSRKIKELEQKTESCFATYFTEGDRKAGELTDGCFETNALKFQSAMKRLRLPDVKSEDQFMTTWMTGLLVGLSIPPIVFTLERSKRRYFLLQPEKCPDAYISYFIQYFLRDSFRLTQMRASYSKHTEDSASWSLYCNCFPL
ncbi:hypothetical protein HDU93_008444 [Gonapodya sp. JEL0774]|nr:hypothetical protein HDU93_008444 [Gonapodya sp. JEL0774]